MIRRRLATGLILTALLLAASASAALAAPRSYFDNSRASLTGDKEIPPNDSEGWGQARFMLNGAGDELNYTLRVANIDNVTQSHIHCGGPDVNGPVVAFLFGFVAGGVTTTGILAEGVIDAADIIPRPASPECPGGVADFDDLIDKMQSGQAYVNVHTVAFPGGEIRGQVQ